MEIIFNRTEGWVAGMQLARLSLLDAENQERFRDWLNEKITTQGIAAELIDHAASAEALPPDRR